MTTRALPAPLDWQPLRWAALGTAWLVIALIWFRVVFVSHQWDAHIYWSTSLDATLYAGEWNVGTDAFVYPPPFAQAIAPLTALPWPVFAGLWAALLLGVWVWLAGPVLAAIGLLVFYPFGREVELGQINLLMGAAILLGFRYPAAWAFVLLTKITPGVGLLWFAFRREWSRLGIALGVTAAICAVSYLLGPDLWAAWMARMTADAGAPAHPDAILLLDWPLAIRLGLAAGIIAWAARRDARWAVFIAGALAMPLVTLGRTPILGGALPHLRRALERRRLAEHATAQCDPVDVRVLRPRGSHEV